MDPNPAVGGTIELDSVPGFVVVRSPLFCCGPLRDQPVLDWKGFPSQQLRQVLAVVPDCQRLCRQHDFTLHLSYFLLFVGAFLIGLAVAAGYVTDIAFYGWSAESIGILRMAVLISGLLALGLSVLLNLDSRRQLQAMICRYNDQAGKRLES